MMMKGSLVYGIEVLTHGDYPGNEPPGKRGEYITKFSVIYINLDHRLILSDNKEAVIDPKEKPYIDKHFFPQLRCLAGAEVSFMKCVVKVQRIEIAFQLNRACPAKDETGIAKKFEVYRLG